MASYLIGYGYFQATKTGKTGLTPTVNVFQITRTSLASSQIATAQNATEVGNGIYAYQISSADLKLYDYVFAFITADATVDAQNVPALWTRYAEAETVELAYLDAPISSMLPGGSYVSPPSALLIADAVWDELLATHSISGSAGYGLSSASAGGADPLLNSVPGTYLTGTAGYALGRIGTGQVKTTSIVAENGDVQTYQGDNYLAADGRAIDWTDASASWPELTGKTIKILLCGAVEFTGSIVTATGASKKVRLELTQAQSRTIPANGEFQFVVRAELGTTRWTLVDALWTSHKELWVGG